MITTVRVIVNEYIGSFYRLNKRGHWYKFWQCGNAGVSLDVANLLKKLGHRVEIEERLLHDHDQ